MGSLTGAVALREISIPVTSENQKIESRINQSNLILRFSDQSDFSDPISPWGGSVAIQNGKPSPYFPLPLGEGVSDVALAKSDG